MDLLNNLALGFGVAPRFIAVAAQNAAQASYLSANAAFKRKFKMFQQSR